MKPLDVPAVLAGLPDTLELLDVPMFVLTVGQDGTVRFAGLNRAYEARTGLSHGELAGRSPHEVLSERHAEGVVARCRVCIESGASTRFEEVVEVPTGRIWWQTTLSPVMDQGRVIAIVGTSADVTALHAQIDDLKSDAEGLRARAAQMQGQAEACIGRMRAPLTNILTFSRLARESVAEEGAEGDDQLSRIQETAAEALAAVEGFERESAAPALPPVRHMREVAFGEVCRDLTALVDPNRRWSITFPEARVLADAGAVETVLHSLIEEAAGLARSWIGLAVSPDPRRRQSIRLHVRCDLRDGAELPDFAGASGIVRARGGKLGVEHGSEADGPRATLTFAATLPGRFLEAARTIDPASGAVLGS